MSCRDALAYPAKPLPTEEEARDENGEGSNHSEEGGCRAECGGDFRHVTFFLSYESGQPPVGFCEFPPIRANPHERKGLKKLEQMRT